jgi:chloramphenicol O-acetyltransferase
MQEILQYLWDNYGRIIQRVDPVWIPFAIQVHHPAIDFYDKYFKEGVISQEQREHLKVWHGLHEE